MVKKRKAQGLSINVIILAIIGLIVLVVLIAIFSKQSSQSINTLESCEGRGGQCTTAINCNIREFKLDNAKCQKDEICCVNIFKQNGN